MTRRSRKSPLPPSPGIARRSPRSKQAAAAAAAGKNLATPPKSSLSTPKKGSAGSKQKQTRKCVSKIEFEEGEFEVGDDVYVSKSESASHESDEEVEECQVCGKVGGSIMLECDDCLGGYHLSCLNPPLNEVPEGDWKCPGCLGTGQVIPVKKNRHRTARARVLARDLWVARIQQLWEEADGSKWFSGTWYVVPEETAMGRQPHNGRRELFRTNQTDRNEMSTIVRNCYVMDRENFEKASMDGDDVFLCEYEYDVKWQTFKRIVDMDNGDGELCDEMGDDEDANEEYLERRSKKRKIESSKPGRHTKMEKLEIGLQRLRAKTIRNDGRRKPATEFEKAKTCLVLSAVPGYLPCRDKERREIETFVADALAGAECLGKCLYISGVPGTGKTATVLDVMRGLEKQVSRNEPHRYCFVHLNGLSLTSPEQAYTVILEALTGQRVGSKKALQLLNLRFSQSKSSKARPCVLLVDELDLLVTRTQSVLYNLFDWPCRPNSRLIIIGIANTIDLPERLLPRIASRMGLQRICFSPYNYTQLQEIILSRLSGIQVFQRAAIEFASRKVAAVSGDARRALELCRRGAEIAEWRVANESNNENVVGIGDIEAAIAEMFQAPHIQIMKRCSKQAKILLTALVFEQNRSGMAENSFEQVARAHSLLCTANSEIIPNRDALLTLVSRLGECRILICESSSKHRLQKMQLNFPTDDVSFALKESPELPWISRYLS